MTNPNPCDVDDILCQAEELNKLKIIRSVLDDKFKENYPSLTEFESQLDENILTKETAIREKLGGCNLSPDIIEPGPEESPPEE